MLLCKRLMLIKWLTTTVEQTYKGCLTAANNFKEECLARTVVFWEDQVVI